MLHHIARVVGDGVSNFYSADLSTAQAAKVLDGVRQAVRVASGGSAVGAAAASAALVTEAAGLVALPLLFATLTHDELIATTVRNRLRQREADYRLLTGRDILEFSDRTLIEGAVLLHDATPSLTPVELEAVRHWVLSIPEEVMSPHLSVGAPRGDIVEEAKRNRGRYVDPAEYEVAADAMGNWLRNHCDGISYIKYIVVRTPEGGLRLWIAPYNPQSFKIQHKELLEKALQRCPLCKLVAAGSIQLPDCDKPNEIDIRGDSGNFPTLASKIMYDFGDFVDNIDHAHAGMKTVIPLFKHLFPGATVSP